MPAQPPATLVFDLDGTLLDVSARNHHVYSTLCSSLGGDPLDRTTYWRLKRLRAGWPQILGASGLTPDLFASFESEFEAQIGCRSTSGSTSCFHPPFRCSPRSRRTTSACWSRCATRRRRCARKLGVLALRPFFEVIESGRGDGEAAFKVKAGLIRKAVPPGTPAIVIGDTESDVMAASSLDYPCIAVCSGIREREILEVQEPAYLVDDLGGVEGALRSAGAL